MPELSQDAVASRSERLRRLLQLRDDRFPPAERDMRIRRATEQLHTLPDTLHLDPEDARWIAESADLEDI